MNADQLKEQMVRYWWTKALESQEAAKRDLAAEDLSLAINRLYYALFYAVSALFLEEDRTFTKHSGLRAALNRELIKSGRFARQHGELYNRLFRDRQKGDYLVFAEFDRAYVEEQLAASEAFLEDLKSLFTLSIESH